MAQPDSAADVAALLGTLAGGSAVLVDCLTLWLTNRLMPLPEGAPPPEEGDPAARPDPQLAHLDSVVGLVWRSVVLWMLLLALLTLANVLG